MRVHDSNNHKTYFRKQRRRDDQRGTITAYSDCLILSHTRGVGGRKFEQRFGGLRPRLTLFKRYNFFHNQIANPTINIDRRTPPTRTSETAVDWEWASARWYAGEEDVPLQMDRTLPMVEE